MHYHGPLAEGLLVGDWHNKWPRIGNDLRRTRLPAGTAMVPLAPHPSVGQSLGARWQTSSNRSISVISVALPAERLSDGRRSTPV
jgi:hypothetical protein